MSRAQVVPDGCLAYGGRLRHQARCAAERRGHRTHALKDVLGEAAWQRLPPAVRARFADASDAADYAGVFETVRASPLGRILAWACQLIGTPVVPRTGAQVPAVVRVRPTARGTQWSREYRWPGSPPCRVCSTKVIGADGTLVEELPARLCMPLEVYEAGGILHFVSRSYCFELVLPGIRRRVRLVLPQWLSPGTTHVQHIDEGDGWFRFTMAVTHPFFGETFYQTGRFRALGG